GRAFDPTIAASGKLVSWLPAGVSTVASPLSLSTASVYPASLTTMSSRVSAAAEDGWVESRSGPCPANHDAASAADTTNVTERAMPAARATRLEEARGSSRRHPALTPAA